MHTCVYMSRSSWLQELTYLVSEERKKDRNRDTDSIGRSGLLDGKTVGPQKFSMIISYTLIGRCFQFIFVGCVRKGVICRP